ncbi:FYVE-domain-containing protein [Serendipita vermifera]|nr:FYVE-domain-containing protein [Serendipita vermifera]
MSAAVPYKAYQSKRHSRNLSSTFTPPQSPPLIPVGSPSKALPTPASNGSPKINPIRSTPIDSPNVDYASTSATPAAPASPALRAVTPPSVVQNPGGPNTAVAPISIQEVPPSPISESNTAPVSPRVLDEPSKATPTSTVSSIPIPLVVEPPKNELAAPASPSTSTATTSAATGNLPTTTARPRVLSNSTFRHVPARGSPLRPSASVLKHSPSPLGSNTHVSHTPLTLGTPSRATPAAVTSHQPHSRPGAGNAKILDFSSSPTLSPLAIPTGTHTPPIPSPLSSTALNPSPKPLPSPLLSAQGESASTGSKSRSATPSPSASPSRPSAFPVPNTSSVTSGSSASTIHPPSRPASTASRVVGATPYRHGFQPKGVYGMRTDEFVELRRAKRDAAKIEDRRLERRLEKLIDLHFLSGASKASNPPSPGGLDPSKPPANRRQSSFFDFNLPDLKGKNASDLWRDVVDSAASSKLLNSKGDIRQQEQAITPWQEDSAVSACPLCLTSFNALTNRKHHCRLCGRVVCSLPVKHPVRPELCSFLFVVDSKTGMIEEVGGEVVDYGVKRRDVMTSGQGKNEAALAKKMLEDQEKYLKGVRICKDCRPTLRRRQYSVEARTVPPFARLYEALLIIEKEIEETLPEFQELVIRLSQEDDIATPTTPNASQNPVKQATTLRKQLLESFTQYDAIAKRIKGLKTSGPGSSQDRVQNAIANRATLFLQKNMFPLQSLPKPRKQTHAKNTSVTTLSLPSNLVDITDSDAALAHTLQPLLEQEALLESFIEEANAQRKFEDAKTLKANLREIRVEIDRLLNGRDLKAGTSGNG